MTALLPPGGRRGHPRRDPADFARWFREEPTLSGYRLLSEYATGKDPVRVLHEACGREFSMRPDLLARGRRCPHCFRTRLKTAAQYQADLDAKFGAGAYAVAGPYVDNATPCALRHVGGCGGLWSPKPRDALSRRRPNGCAACFGTPLMSAEKWAEALRRDAGDAYEPAGPYLGLRVKAAVRHVPCGTVFEARPTDVRRRHMKPVRCPACEADGPRVALRKIVLAAVRAMGLEAEEEALLSRGAGSGRGVARADVLVSDPALAVFVGEAVGTSAQSEEACLGLGLPSVRVREAGPGILDALGAALEGAGWDGRPRTR